MFSWDHPKDSELSSKTDALSYLFLGPSQGAEAAESYLKAIEAGAVGELLATSYYNRRFLPHWLAAANPPP